LKAEPGSSRSRHCRRDLAVHRLQSIARVRARDA
jgi:hypothetical protein